MPVTPLSSVTVPACATPAAHTTATAHTRVTTRCTLQLYVEGDGGTLVRRMRLPLGWAAIVCVMALSGIAHGQIAGDGFGIERFRLATGSGMLDVDSPNVGPHLDYSAGLAIGFAHDPLVIYDTQMAAVDPLVERRLSTDIV